MKTNLLRSACLALPLLALSACKPEPPPTDKPPEPKAATADATQLRDAIQQPIDRAKAVDAASQQAADDQRAAIDAATQ
ncbi:hypothetical protein DT603_13180 [Pseudoxanthomonas gei]|uniref:Lipoprotein n=1 Tax=Pseudoxanthomonas gei TaxID=1383030 RepID=A0ABX0AJV6_9GAMM|nr:hypothetical protein [Pseudoxanthomonas gei]NDK39791.1 hypothetical protein [Pseudoxanthomonas gei]